MKLTKREYQPIDINQPMWWGWRRWTWVKIAFGFVVLMGAFSTYLVQRNGEEDRARQAQASLDQDYKTCVKGNDTRGVLRQLVALTSTNAIDLTVVPGFSELPETVKIWVMNLKKLSEAARENQADNPNSFQAQAAKILSDRDCGLEFPGHT